VAHDLRGIDAADFCIFVVAGRYGAMSDEPDVAWTHREFREAVRQKKPVIGMLHSRPESIPLGMSEQTEEGRARLAEFRGEMEKQTLCRYFATETELVQGVVASIEKLREDKRIEGWVPAGRNPVVLQEADFDRIYELIDIEWAFKASGDGSDTWDGHYRGRRVLTANDPPGCRPARSTSRETQTSTRLWHFPGAESVEGRGSGAGRVDGLMS